MCKQTFTQLISNIKGDNLFLVEELRGPGKADRECVLSQAEFRRRQHYVEKRRTPFFPRARKEPERINTESPDLLNFIKRDLRAITQTNDVNVLVTIVKGLLKRVPFVELNQRLRIYLQEYTDAFVHELRVFVTHSGLFGCSVGLFDEHIRRTLPSKPTDIVDLTSSPPLV